MLPNVDERAETEFTYELLISLPMDDDGSVQLSLFDAAGAGYLDDEFRGCYFLG